MADRVGVHHQRFEPHRRGLAVAEAELAPARRDVGVPLEMRGELAGRRLGHLLGRVLGGDEHRIGHRDIELPLGEHPRFALRHRERSAHRLVALCGEDRDGGVEPAEPKHAEGLGQRRVHELRGVAPADHGLSPSAKITEHTLGRLAQEALVELASAEL